MKDYSKDNYRFKTAVLALVCLSLIVFLGKSYETSLRGIDSNIHSRISLNVTNKGISPTLPMPGTNSGGNPGISTFNDHPFLYFWMNGQVMRALGPSAWSARLLTGIFSTGCVTLILLIGSLLYSELFGFIAAFLYLSIRDIVLTGAGVSLDPPLLFFILLSFYLWFRKRSILSGIAAGIGLSIKTPVALLLFPSIFLASFANRKIESRLKVLALSASVSLLVGTCFWLITAYLGGWGTVQAYWVKQLWATAVNGRNLNYPPDWTMLFRMIRHGFIPWLPLLFVGIFKIIKSQRWREPLALTSFSAIIVLFLAISPLRFKMEYYFNPVFPFLAILSTYAVVDVAEKWKEQIYGIFSWVAIVLSAVLLTTPISFGPEGFPGLAHFVPYIQKYASCHDPIVLVPGGEPVGGYLDSALFLNFNTGRVVDVRDCSFLRADIQKSEVKWIILSKTHYQECLPVELKALFPSKWIYENQILLSKIVLRDEGMDLSPLKNKLIPSEPCKN